MKILKNHRSGFSLLELLLAIGIMTALGTGAAALFDQWAKKTVNRKVATEMQKLQDAAEAYVEFNFDRLINSEVPSVGDIFEVDIDDIVESGFLAENYEPINSFRQEMRVIIRHVADDGVNEDIIEVLSLGDNQEVIDARVEDGRLFEAATAGGPALGIISDLDTGSNCCRGNIQSIHGTWSVDLNDFATLYNTTPDANGGYMASYGRISVVAEADQPYLYRVEMPGQEHLNRMNTNLDMNGHNIVNGGVIVSDSVNVSGDADFLGEETNNIDSAYVLAVQDDFDIGRDLQVLAGTSNKGEIFIRGDDTAEDDFVVTGRLKTYIDGGTVGHSSVADASGGVSADNIFATNLSEMQNGVFDTMSVGVGGLNSGSLIGVQVISKNSIDASSLQTSRTENVQNINASSAIVGTTTFGTSSATIIGNVTSEGSISTERGDLFVNGVVTGSTAVRIENLNCDVAGECP